MLIILAPMEGVVNARMRALLTAQGGIDRCVTEFVRVTDTLLPARVFHRLCPELETDGCTPSGTPVHVQLLGSEPKVLAANAARAAKLGALGIDLNFGCPAKVVNRHRGGSVLLNEPELVGHIVKAVRDAVPADIPVSAKVRLGFECPSALAEVARHVDAAGADELTIHARTKVDGYKPPAWWHQVKPISNTLRTRLIINGEIWTPADANQALTDSGCEHLMIGRGLLASPDLARRIRENQHQAMPWTIVHELLTNFFEDCLITLPERHVGGPLKQWLGYLRREYGEAQRLLERVKRLREGAALSQALALSPSSDSV